MTQHKTDDLHLILNAWQVYVLICFCLPFFLQKLRLLFEMGLFYTYGFKLLLYTKIPGKKMTAQEKKLQSYLKKSGLPAYSGKCQRVHGINSMWQV